MANLKVVRTRIQSVKSTQQITKAMKMVAASKLRKAQDAILLMRPYVQKLAGIMKNARGAAGKTMTLKYQGLHGHERPEGWKGDGLLYPGFTKDDTQWNWWLAYHKAMSQDHA